MCQLLKRWMELPCPGDQCRTAALGADEMQGVRHFLHCPEVQGVRECSLALPSGTKRWISKMVERPKCHVMALVLTCWLNCFLPPTHTAKAERCPFNFSSSLQPTTCTSLLWHLLKRRASSSISEPHSRRRVIWVQ